MVQFSLILHQEDVEENPTFTVLAVVCKQVKFGGGGNSCDNDQLFHQRTGTMFLT